MTGQLLNEVMKMNETKLNYRFEADRLLSHETAMISRGLCDSFLPTSYIYDMGGITAVYDSDGYKPLSEYRIEETGDILYILEKILLMLRRSQDYLFAPERILISPETVFYQQDTGDMKIAFIPIAGNNNDLHRNILQFLIRTKGDLCDPFISYLNVFAHKSVNDNLSLEDMLTLAGYLRRQLDIKIKEIA